MKREALVVAGVDEAGRGPLAGPVVACALGLILSKPWHGDRRIVRATGVVLLLVLIAGGVARLTLPMPPQSYEAMLGGT